MKFGSRPLTHALGHVLAHSVAVAGGRLRKGRVLDSDDIAALRAAGLTAVTVASLEATDRGEDEAADALADALLVGQEGLSRSTAFTGRVNLIADHAGVAMLDVEALHRVNAIDPMITVATVPPHHQLRAGDMVATIKIISYAVPEENLNKAIQAARGAIGIATPKHRAATLIITEISGGASDKGRDAIEGRLNALGVELAAVPKVPHEKEALAKAVQAAETSLVLILTGSATSDIDDVASSAVVDAGGEIIRFGMPVDPGNLLFLGAVGKQSVIGLPGCARSPALNGADWVLSRVICGVNVSSADIAGMGVGGLLKEIPTRPQPRMARR
ncbi:molybdopterin-binding protein [Sulfitobacter donghicola]|uniref:Molybdopterin biosynthesis protein n=1 Tax=Sulfitobacter donghicola DSW-25 = KCTC 12864 = JCM 14565 TaxID=1300350 RepID=A0A073IKZ2_9RHOB|nr:molybdopterin-binding protein [Sulfitobacter donghicola]KEJ90255.1 molybdopterin biosynthesis protein [Sulfitobacter donghicola DSW-25 = KCTC 12864 = JCM 14565]KIN66575.1 Molybdopterin biosynthesis protein [Sulfitobacter donghicola DSW-25 = KCTC 12864 = JCM 14565]